MTRIALAAVVAMALSVAADRVAGKWVMTVDTGSAHGITTMGLTLEQEGKNVTGTFHSPHGDVAVTGEFADGTLRLSTSGNAEVSVSFSAKLRDDGTIGGHMSTPRGDMKFTAEREREEAKRALGPPRATELVGVQGTPTI